MKQNPETPVVAGSKRGALAWALYDVANSAFALLILTAIFPIFFGRFWAADMPQGESTYWLGLSASVASAIVALLAPFAGAWSDSRNKRKLLLALFTLAGASATAGLAAPGLGQWQAACILYIIGVAGFSLGNVVYDALLPAVSTDANRHRISALGFSLGYLGSTLLLVAALIVIEKHQAFGIELKSDATRIVFLLTAVWWVLWTIPLMLRVKEPQEAPREGSSLKFLLATVVEAARTPAVRWFLIAFFFYNDAVGTIIRLAAKVAADIGTAQSELMAAIILVQLVGVPASLVFGWFGSRWGPRVPLMVAVGTYVVVAIVGGTLSGQPIRVGGWALSPVILLGIMIGLVQGGVQSLSRSFFANLIPQEKAGAFFGLYNVIGKGAAIAGPLVMALVARASGQTQLGFLALTPFLLIGLLILWLMPAGRRTR